MRFKMSEFRVKLITFSQNPQTLAAAAALGCFEEKSSIELFDDLSALPEKERQKKERGVLKNSFGRGHGSVGDQTHFTFGIENLPRAATFQLCLPEYLEHLQQSLRRAKASRGFYLPEIIKKSKFASRVEKVLFQSFKLYEKMSNARIPGEDARFLLPLYTKTNITTTGNTRELCHIWQMSHREGVPSIVTAVMDKIISQAKEKAPDLFEDFGFNYETLAWYPSAQLFTPTNTLMERLAELKIDSDVFLVSQHIGSFLQDNITAKTIEKAIKERNEAELSNLKHIHFDFLVAMSLTCLHQAIRQRTWNHSLEPIYHAVENALTRNLAKRKERMVIPPSIRNSEFKTPYQTQHKDMLQLYQELVRGGIPAAEAIGVIPHSLKIYTLIHINGWNAFHSIGKRTCVEAQWEIRKISWDIARIIKKEMPALGNYAEPQCITYGKCPEVRDCGYYKKRENL